MATELQATLKQAWGDQVYDTYAEEALKALEAVPGIRTDSPDDLKAFIGWIIKSHEVERESNRNLFQQRQVLEDGDSGRFDWMESDLRRLLSIFRFARQEGLTVRGTIDWLAGNPDDERLPAEFIEAFNEASKTDSIAHAELPKLFTWIPNCHGPQSLQVLATNEATAREAVEAHIRATPWYANYPADVEQWQSGGYTLTVSEFGEVVTHAND